MNMALVENFAKFALKLDGGKESNFGNLHFSDSFGGVISKYLR
jgi:hypothetical protein